MADNMINLDGLTHVWGKVKTLTNSCAKLTDLATVATTGSYNDLKDKPETFDVATMVGASSTSDGKKGLVPQPYLGDQDKYLKANGTWSVVNTTTVNGHTVNSDVPANAKFTDTIYIHPNSHPASMITGLANVAKSGSYNDLINKPTIPTAYTLPNATTTTKGGVQIGDNITVSSGIISLTKANIVNALGYTPPTTDTSYSVATSSSNGLMSSTDKSKLDKIEAGANNYTHPSSHPASMITGLSAVATSGSYDDLSGKPDLSLYPKTNVANTWTGTQYFGTTRFTMERYKTEYVTGTSASPTSSGACYTATGNFTINLSNMGEMLANGDSTVFSTFLISSADYTLRITGVDIFKYLGDPSDLAITNSGLLLNIFLQKNTAGVTIAIIQGTKLINE